MSSTICWKKIWLTLAGDIKTVTIGEAKDVLNLVKGELLEGLAQYKPYNKDGTLDLIPVLGIKLKEKGGNLEVFIQKLTQHINLQIDIGWKVFCNFLIFEYYGKIEDIQKLAEYELYNTNLFRQLWLFYSSERMYMIKTLKHILENGNNEKNNFSTVYKEFLIDCDVSKIRKSLLEQFKLLTEEIKKENEECCMDFNDWVVRNHREQIETLHCLMLTTEYKFYNIHEFISLIDTFKKFNFSMTPSHERILNISLPEELKKIRMIQLSCLLLATKNFWDDPKEFQTYSNVIAANIFNISHLNELSILLTLYTTLQLRTADQKTIEKYTPIYIKYIRQGLDQKVYYHLYEILSLSDWKNTHVGVLIKKMIFQFVEYTCYNFEDTLTILYFEGIDELISKLAEERDFALTMMKSDNVYKKYYLNLIEMLPHSFVSFSKVTMKLLEHKELFQVIYEKMNDLKTFTEGYNDVPYESELVLRQDYQPKILKMLKIPIGTRARIKEILGTLYISFEFNYTYFDVLESLASLVLCENEIAKENIPFVYLGYQCLIPILKNDKIIKQKSIIGGLNLMQSVLFRVSTRPLINSELISTCLDLCTLLLKKDPERIAEGLLINNFLPHAVKDVTNINNFFENNFLNTCIILLSIRDEISWGKVEVLFSYIKFLKELINLNKCTRKVLIPGLVFLFVHVFPLHLHWNYETTAEKQRLSDECLGVMLIILQNNYKELSEDEKIIYDFCYRLIIDHIPTIDMINKLFRMTNTYLNTSMMNESDWERRSFIIQVQCLKKVLAIINIILLLHNRGERNLKGTNFLETFLDSSIKPSSLKLLTGYMQQSFDLTIPKLSCQILKKLAVNSDVPMLSLLEMDKYQLQCTFLEKLRDPLEEENLKVAILDLITLCVQNQSGMIVAFFDISNLPGTENITDIGDSVTAFMEEYLENIRKSTDYLYSPIQAAVLDLFHALWMYRKNVLVSDLTKNENFWTTLMDPLFKDLKLPNKTYTQILNILTYELFRSKGSNNKINEVVLKLFSNNEKYSVIWCNYIIKSLKNQNSKHQNVIELLRSWKNLLIATCKNYPEALSKKKQLLLAETCLDGMIEHFTTLDIRILSLWAEIYLYLITQWDNPCLEISSKVLETLTRVLKHMENFYWDISNHLKEVMLSISVKTAKDLDNYSMNALAIEEYLQVIGKIFEKEYITITRKNIQNEDKSIYSNWLLLITFGTHLLKSELKVCKDWFRLTQFLSKILNSIGPFLQNSLYFPIGKITVQCLIAYANSPLVDHFIYVDLERFFDSTRSTERYINTTELSYKNALPWHFENWWLTYTGIIQLLTILLKKYGRLMFGRIISFAVVHCDVIKNSLRLPMVTTELTALRLVRECLRFTNEMLKFKTEWRLRFPQIYFSYLQSINETINSVTCIILRPTVLKFFAIDKESSHLTFVDHLPTHCLVEIVNALMEVISYSCLCLLRVCPNMINLLEPYKMPFTDDVQIEYDFHIPKIYDETANQLKYGTLLCLLHFLCKTSYGQKSQSTSTTDLNGSDTTPCNEYLSFVCSDYFGTSIADKYNSLQTFAASEHSRLSTKWLAGLDQERVNFALETLTTFLAMQTYLTTYARLLTPFELHHIKRELCSEFLYFQEFARKKAADFQQYKTVDNFVYRKFYTETVPYLLTGTLERFAVVTPEHKFDEPEISPRYGDFLDEEIDENDTIFYERNSFKSYIPTKKPVEHKRKTPKPRSRYFGIRGSEKVLVERVFLGYPTENLTHNPGDYLLMLSHWFFHICQLSH